MSVGNRIKLLREVNNLSQMELGNMLFKSKNCISSWEQDRNEIDFLALVELSKIFKVSIDFILKDALIEEITHLRNPNYQQLKLLIRLNGLPRQSLDDVLTLVNILRKYRRPFE